MPPGQVKAARRMLQDLRVSIVTSALVSCMCNAHQSWLLLQRCQSWTAYVSVSMLLSYAFASFPAAARPKLLHLRPCSLTCISSVCFASWEGKGGVAGQRRGRGVGFVTHACPNAGLTSSALCVALPQWKLIPCAACCLQGML